MFVLLCLFMKKKTGSVFPTFCNATFQHAKLITCCNVSRAGIHLILLKVMWPRIKQCPLSLLPISAYFSSLKNVCKKHFDVIRFLLFRNKHNKWSQRPLLMLPMPTSFSGFYIPSAIFSIFLTKIRSFKVGLNYVFLERETHIRHVYSHTWFVWMI